MDILFVALNAPVNSNNNGHWFTNNLSFWNLLYRAGIITKPITDMLDGDEKVFGDTTINYINWTIGVTDLIGNVVETNSSKVVPSPADVKRIFEILHHNQVKRLCLIHSKVGEAFKNYFGITFNPNRYGLIAHYRGTDIYEVPFHNASVANKDYYYALLIDKKSGHNQVVQEKNAVEKRILPTQSDNIKSTSPEFILPKPGNSITEEDIKKGQLRITVDFKKHFPSESKTVKIKYWGKTHIVSFTYKDGRSHILKVGKDFMEKLNINSRSKIKVNFQDGKYLLNVI